MACQEGRRVYLLNDLGPAWFIERLDSKIEKGDRIEVKGSRVTVTEGGP